VGLRHLWRFCLGSSTSLRIGPLSRPVRPGCLLCSAHSHPCCFADSAISLVHPLVNNPNCFYLGSRIFLAPPHCLPLSPHLKMSRLLSETGDPSFFCPRNQAVAYLLVQPFPKTDTHYTKTTNFYANLPTQP
jgi:hypothetical protein